MRTKSSLDTTLTLQVDRGELRRFARNIRAQCIRDGRSNLSIRNYLAVALDKGMREIRENHERVDFNDLMHGGGQ